MKPFTKHTGIVVPLDRMNIDTDLIIPKQFLKSIKRSGFGENLFDQLRYLDEGHPGMDASSRPINPDFILNKAPFTTATILLVGDNFGCGSSREHAVWALKDYGFRVVIGTSFADIFYNNCFKNGLLAITLGRTTIDTLFRLATNSEKFLLKVDLVKGEIELPADTSIPFAIEPFHQQRLLKGLDDIGATLKHQKMIEDFERKRALDYPWLFANTP